MNLLPLDILDGDIRNLFRKIEALPKRHKALALGYVEMFLNVHQQGIDTQRAPLKPQASGSVPLSREMFHIRTLRNN